MNKNNKFNKANNKNKVSNKKFKKFKQKKAKIDKKQNKEIQQIKNYLKSFSKKMNFVLPYQPKYNLKNFHNQVSEYIKGLLFPEQYIERGIKLPSPIGSYSFCYGFKETFDLTPATDGAFRIIWNPNCLAGQTIRMGTKDIMGGPTLNIDNGGTVTNAVFLYPSRFLYSDSNLTDNTIKWKIPITQTYNGSAEGYRLVSASVYIEYIGTNLNKSGYILSIPSYRPVPIYSTQSNTSEVFTDSDRIPTIGESNFVNTKGSLTSFILRPNSKCKRVWIPCDPSDLIYEDMGYFYSSAVSSSQSHQDVTADQGVEKGLIKLAQTTNHYLRILNSEDGNPLKYIFLGKGFQNDNNCIHVTAYYNFELLPTEGVRMPNNDEGKKKLNNNIKNQVIEKAAQVIINKINDNHQVPNMNDVQDIAREVIIENPQAQDQADDLWEPVKKYAPKIFKEWSNNRGFDIIESKSF